MSIRYVNQFRYGHIEYVVINDNGFIVVVFESFIGLIATYKHPFTTQFLFHHIRFATVRRPIYDIVSFAHLSSWFRQSCVTDITWPDDFRSGGRVVRPPKREYSSVSSVQIRVHVSNSHTGCSTLDKISAGNEVTPGSLTSLSEWLAGRIKLPMFYDRTGICIRFASTYSSSNHILLGLLRGASLWLHVRAPLRVHILLCFRHRLLCANRVLVVALPMMFLRGRT